jgi:hypothetical protein
VHVINGMGVALGDSVIGLSALAALRDAHPRLRFTLYRPARAPRYVEALYALAADVVAPSHALPYRADALPAHEPRIDIGNHLYWPAFARLPMIDFFLDALGADAAAVPAAAKRNRWLARLPRGSARTCCSARTRAPRCAACRPRCARRSSIGSCSATDCRWSASVRSRIRLTRT